MRAWTKTLLTLGVAILLVSPAAAQERKKGGQRPGGGAFGGFGELLLNESVQKELKLDEGQIAKVREMNEALGAKRKEAFGQLQNVSREEMMEKMREIMKPINDERAKTVAAILKPEQAKRLHQIELQQMGVRAFADAKLQEALKLTADQKDAIKTISADTEKETRSLRPMFGGGAGGFDREKFAENQKKITALEKAATEKINDVLTAEQKKTLKDEMGAPFEIQRGERRKKDN